MKLNSETIKEKHPDPRTQHPYTINWAHDRKNKHFLPIQVNAP